MRSFPHYPQAISPLPRTPSPFTAASVTLLLHCLGGSRTDRRFGSLSERRAHTALVLFAELGPDLSRFPTAAQFASWLNLCPHNQITGGKIISSHTGPGTSRAAQALRWATQSLYRSPSSLGQHFRRMRARQGTPHATTATAHKLARIIYHLITHRVAYDDSILAAEERQDLRRFEHRLRRQARALGFELTPQAA